MLALDRAVAALSRSRDIFGKHMLKGATVLTLQIVGVLQGTSTTVLLSIVLVDTWVHLGASTARGSSFFSSDRRISRGAPNERCCSFAQPVKGLESP